MPTYSYKAATATGEVIEKRIEATSRESVIAQLHRSGQTPIRIDLAKGSTPNAGKAMRLGRQSARAELLLFTRGLAMLLEAGLPLDRALKTTSDLAATAGERDLAVHLSEAIKKGSTLADAMAAKAATFSPFYVNLVRAGETGGSLPQILDRIASSLERQAILADSIRSALIYPAIVIVMAMASLLFLVLGVIPQFRPLFEDSGRAMPMSMSSLILTGDVIRNWWWAILSIGLGSVLLLRVRLKTVSGQVWLDRRLRTAPVIGRFIVKLEFARLSATLGTLLQNGVSTLQAVSIALGTIANHGVAEALADIPARLRRGEGLARALAEAQITPDIAVQMVRIGEEGGQLDKMLLKIADLLEAETARSIERGLALLVPIITILMGGIVAIIVASMLSAILSTYSVAL